MGKPLDLPGIARNGARGLVCVSTVRGCMDAAVADDGGLRGPILCALAPPRPHVFGHRTRIRAFPMRRPWWSDAPRPTAPRSCRFGRVGDDAAAGGPSLCAGDAAPGPSLDRKCGLVRFARNVVEALWGVDAVCGCMDAAVVDDAAPRAALLCFCVFGIRHTIRTCHARPCAPRVETAPA